MSDLVLTPQQIAAINAATSIAEIEAIAATFSSQGQIGQTAIFYSGDNMHELAIQVRNSDPSRYYLIEDTDRGKFLNSFEVEAKLAQLFPVQADRLANMVFAHNSPWDNASRAFAESINGNVYAFLDESAHPDSIFRRTELPALLVHTGDFLINGVSPSELGNLSLTEKFSLLAATPELVRFSMVLQNAEDIGGKLGHLGITPGQVVATVAGLFFASLISPEAFAAEVEYQKTNYAGALIGTAVFGAILLFTGLSSSTILPLVLGPLAVIGLIDSAEHLWDLFEGAFPNLAHFIEHIPFYFWVGLHVLNPLNLFRSDPLTLDLDGDGIELVSLANSNVNFDLDGNGFAERTGWVSADDGMLVRDGNRNGNVDSVAELFGSATQDGFAVLETFDDNQDGRIDAADKVFVDLKVWRDLNQNGVSEAGELFTLTQLGIQSIWSPYLRLAA